MFPCSCYERLLLVCFIWLILEKRVNCILACADVFHTLGIDYNLLHSGHFAEYYVHEGRNIGYVDSSVGVDVGVLGLSVS